MSQESRKSLRILQWLAVAVVIVALDLWTKQYASAHLELYRPYEVFPGLNMTLAHNYGAAFSFLSDQGGWQRWFFTILSIGITAFLLIWLFRLPAAAWRVGVALGLIIGGAIGNLYDRIDLGYVVDFIQVYYKDSAFPTFNIADSAITCGVVLLLIDSFLTWRQERKDKAVVADEETP